jgi:hypothetical protein
LHWAATNGHERVVELLITKGKANHKVTAAKCGIWLMEDMKRYRKGLKEDSYVPIGYKTINGVCKV